MCRPNRRALARTIAGLTATGRRATAAVTGLRDIGIASHTAAPTTWRRAMNTAISRIATIAATAADSTATTTADADATTTAVSTTVTPTDSEIVSTGALRAFLQAGRASGRLFRSGSPLSRLS